MNMKFELAEDAAKLALKVPGAAEAAAHAIKSAGRLLEETMPHSMTGSIVNAEERAQHLLSGFEPPQAAITRRSETARPFTAPETPSVKDYDISNYKSVPARSLMRDIRTADGVSLQHVDGPSRIVFDDKNSVQHVLVSRNATDVERDKQLLTAAYAGLIHNDVLAQEAAGKVVGQSIGFFSRPIERFATPAQMQQNAVDGARAYFEKDAAGANSYTKFLSDRFGPANFEESRTIVNPFAAHAPSVPDSLLKAGMPITPENRAAAAAGRIIPAFDGGLARVPKSMADEALNAGRNRPPSPRDTHGAAQRVLPFSSKPTIARDILDLRSPEFRNLTSHD